MPGTETTTTGLYSNPRGCSFRTQQGAHHQPPAAPHRRSVPPREGAGVLDRVAVAGSRLASVSAYEHPDLTCAGHGLLGHLRGLGAP